MKHLSFAVFLLFVGHCMASEYQNEEQVSEAHPTRSLIPLEKNGDLDLTHVEDAAEPITVSHGDSQGRSQTASTASDVTSNDNPITPMETDGREASDGKKTTAEVGSINGPAPSPASLSDERLTLDELLRQIRRTPRLEHEGLLARLAERRRLAISLRSTLEAAEQVAAFGTPGAQLLQDASLDTVIATMIADQKRERQEREKSTIPTSSTPAENRLSEDASAEHAVSEQVERFEDWQAVYIVRDAVGHRVGWRHRRNDERAITFVGERWEIGQDSVTVLGVATDRSGKHLLIDVNGGTREVRL